MPLAPTTSESCSLLPGLASTAGAVGAPRSHAGLGTALTAARQVR